MLSTKVSGKKLRLVVTGTLAIAVTICTVQSAQAASSANTSANAVASVITSIAISKVADLDFGDAARDDIAKSINAATGIGTPAVGTSTRAQFTVTGQAAKTYSITFGASSINMTNTTTGLSDADNTIVVNTFTSSPSGTGTLTGGTETLYVGATRAAIRATQAAGSYSGSFTVTVAYP